MTRKWQLVSFLPLAAAGVVIVSFLPGSKPQKIDLADGSTVILAHARYGLRHHSPVGAPWDRLLALVPEDWISRFQSPPAGYRSDRNSLVAWLHWINRPNASLTKVVAVDKHGNEASVPGWTYRSPGESTGGTEFWEGFEIPVFPRRSEAFRLRLYRRDAGAFVRYSSIGEFDIPNPAKRDYPVWEPETLPSVKHVGDLEFSLVRLSLGTPTGPSQFSPLAWPHAAFQIRRGGETVTNWQPVRIHLSDATGNRVDSAVTSVHQQGPDHIACLLDGFWPDEVWRLDVEFAQLSDFDIADLWPVETLPLPSLTRTDYTATNLSTTLHGSTIHLAVVADSSSRNNADTDSPECRVNVQATVQASVDGRRLTLATIKDNRGRTYHPARFEHPGNRFEYAVTMPADARSFDVKFALHRPRVVQFLAKPTGADGFR